MHDVCISQWRFFFFSSSKVEGNYCSLRIGGEEIIAADTQQKLNNEKKNKTGSNGKHFSNVSVNVKALLKEKRQQTFLSFLLEKIFLLKDREIKCWAFRMAQTIQTVPPANDPSGGGGGGGIIGVRADRNKKMGIERGAAERD